MGKINVLSPEVYNRIAAGEVVDGPYSVVKELVENSLDAGATEIEIKIEKAGKQSIQISDNGFGIEKDDLLSVFLPHATSKIKRAEDLDFISTLGFRGEALSSIGSVAMCEIVSRAKGCKEAYKISCDGQKMGEVQPATRDEGTTIKVKNLFFNTPVRAKFLHSDKKEETEITSFITAFILSNPYVRFTYFVDGKIKLHSFGGGMEEALAQVYGPRTISECYKINAEKNGIHILGFIGSQNFFKPNKSYQHVFLNGRRIANNCIQTAMATAYKAYAMKRQYPFYVLSINVALDFVDVNVHPNKSDVRFIDSNLVFTTVYKIISSILDGTAHAADFVVDATRLPVIKSSTAEKNAPGVVYGGKQQIDAKKFDELYESITNVPTYQEAKKALSKDRDEPLIKRQAAMPDTKLGVDIPFESVQTHIYDEKPKKGTDSFEKAKQQEIIYTSSKYVGVLFNTYLMYEQGENVYIIDQHAAHERLLFDKFSATLKNRHVTSQGMLIPYVLNANETEAAFLSDKLESLISLGFDITPIGPTSFKVSEVPSDLKDIDLPSFFAEVLSDISEYKTIKLEEIFKDKLAMTACKHAIKGGNELTKEEKDTLFSLLKGDMGLKCPHGRPICVKLTKAALEKMFKRIV